MPGCRNSQRGWALPLVLVIILVGSLLGAAVYQYTTSQSLSVTSEYNTLQARYLARAAAEAAVRNWMQSATKPSGTLERVYLVDNGSGARSYVRQSQLSGQRIIGYVDTTVTRETNSSGQFTGRWIVRAVANVNGRTQTVTATSLPIASSTYNTAPPWYENGYIKEGPHTTTTSYYDKYLNTTFNLTFTYHDEIRGTAVVGNSSTETLRFKTTDPNYRVIWPAYAVVVNAPLNLKMRGGSRQAVLVVSAERVVFNKDIRIRVGNLSGGCLALGVPEGLGIRGSDVHAASGYQSKVDPNARYGLVKFSNFYGRSVYLLWDAWWDTKIPSLCNKTYYFKQQNGGRGALPIVVPSLGESYEHQVQDLINNGDLIPADPAVVVSTDPYQNVEWFWN